MITLRAGLRACWVNSFGAERLTIVRHIPRGKRTRSPWTSAPASFSSCSDSGSSLKSIPISCRIVSALCSSSSRPSVFEDLVVRNLAGDVGDDQRGCAPCAPPFSHRVHWDDVTVDLVARPYRIPPASALYRAIVARGRWPDWPICGADLHGSAAPAALTRAGISPHAGISRN